MSQPLVLVNQFGEESINHLNPTVAVGGGTLIPIGSANLVLMSGATAPVDGTTGDNIAGKGSLYIAQDTGKLYVQGGLITSPAWKIVTSA